MTALDDQTAPLDDRGPVAGAVGSGPAALAKLAQRWADLSRRRTHPLTVGQVLRLELGPLWGRSSLAERQAAVEHWLEGNQPGPILTFDIDVQRQSGILSER